MNSSQDRADQISKIRKKTYATPQLQIYGDLRQITQSVTNKNSHDSTGNKT